MLIIINPRETDEEKFCPTCGGHGMQSHIDDGCYTGSICETCSGSGLVPRPDAEVLRRKLAAIAFVAAKSGKRKNVDVK